MWSFKTIPGALGVQPAALVVLGALLLAISGCGGGDSPRRNARPIDAGESSGGNNPEPTATPLQSDATLDVLALSSGYLDRPFDPEVLDVTGVVDSATAAVAVTVRAHNPKAPVIINGDLVPVGQLSRYQRLNPDGETQLTIAVTSEDGSNQAEYLLTIVRSDEPAPDVYDNDLKNSLHLLGAQLVAEDDPGDLADGDERSAAYLPLGATYASVKPAELFVHGARIVKTPDIGDIELADISVIERLPGTDVDLPRTRVLSAPPPPVWDDAPFHVSAAADLDGDGLEETVIAYIDGGGSLYLEVRGHSETDYQIAETLLVDTLSAPHSLHLVAGDRDLEGRDDVLVAAGDDGGFGEVYTIEYHDGLILDPTVLEFDSPSGGPLPVTIRLATGSVDWDSADELVVAVSEHDDATYTGAAYLEVLDDDREGASVLFRTDISIDLDAYSQPVPAVWAQAMVTDLDSDGFGEILVAGLNTLHADDTLADSDPRREDNYILLAYDDQLREFRPADQRYWNYTFQTDLDTRRDLEHIHLNALDLDGDQRKELQVNEVVFENFADSEAEGRPPWSPVCTIPADVYFPANDEFPYTERVAALSVGDFDSDGADEIAYLVASSQSFDDFDAITLFGEACAQDDRIEVEVLDSGPGLTVDMTSVNVDDDSTILQAVPGSHRVTWTEPVIIAALAAAPCGYDIGQNLDACSTSYGESFSVSDEESRAVSFSAGFSVGLNGEGGALTQSEATVKANVDGYLSTLSSVATSVAETVTYSTGPLEDTVIFSTVPYDSYEYRYLRHSEDENRIGQTTAMLLPRAPIVIMVQREYFNRMVLDPNDRIDQAVFTHTPGFLDTYPTAAIRDNLIANRALARDPETGDPLPQPALVSSNAVQVGQGTGSVSVDLAVGSERTSGLGGGISVEVEFELVLAGVLVGGRYGLGVDKEWTTTWGSELSYSGEVGALAAESYLDNRYGFGLFSYYQQHRNGQVFEVVNYWVEQD